LHPRKFSADSRPYPPQENLPVPEKVGEKTISTIPETQAL